MNDLMNEGLICKAENPIYSFECYRKDGVNTVTIKYEGKVHTIETYNPYYVAVDVAAWIDKRKKMPVSIKQFEDKVIEDLREHGLGFLALELHDGARVVNTLSSYFQVRGCPAELDWILAQY